MILLHLEKKKESAMAPLLFILHYCYFSISISSSQGAVRRERMRRNEKCLFRIEAKVQESVVVVMMTQRQDKSLQRCLLIFFPCLVCFCLHQMAFYLDSLYFSAFTWMRRVKKNVCATIIITKGAKSTTLSHNSYQSGCWCGDAK